MHRACRYDFYVVSGTLSNLLQLLHTMLGTSYPVGLVPEFNLVCLYKALLFLAPSPPTDVRWTSIMNNSESASVTIEWDPPSRVREGVYSITPSQLPLT